MRILWTFSFHDTVFIFIINNAFETKKKRWKFWFFWKVTQKIDKKNCLQFFRFTINGRPFWIKKKTNIYVFQMKTLDNIMHTKLIVRGETLRGIFDKSEIFFCFQMKIFF